MVDHDRPSQIRVIGVGNEHRGDDATGLLAARKIRELNLTGVQVWESRGDSGQLMELWQGPASVIVIDAMHSGGTPGMVCRWEAGAEPLPVGYFSGHSTHSLGVAEALELARVLGQLPARLIVYGIEGKTYAPGAAPSVEVARGIEEVVGRVLEEVQSLQAK